jgi:recombinational DNA repair protein RecR
MRFCSQCKSIHHRDEPCFICPIVPKKKKDYLMVVNLGIESIVHLFF